MYKKLLMLCVAFCSTQNTITFSIPLVIGKVLKPACKHYLQKVNANPLTTRLKSTLSGNGAYAASAGTNIPAYKGTSADIPKDITTCNSIACAISAAATTALVCNTAPLGRFLKNKFSLYLCASTLVNASAIIVYGKMVKLRFRNDTINKMVYHE